MVWELGCGNKIVRGWLEKADFERHGVGDSGEEWMGKVDRELDMQWLRHDLSVVHWLWVTSACAL